MIRVIALEKGYYGGQLRRKGESFWLQDGSDLSYWVVEADEPAKPQAQQPKPSKGKAKK